MKEDVPSDKVCLVLVGHSLLSFLVGRIKIYDRVNRLPVVHGRSGRNARVGLAMVMEQLPTRRIEGRTIWEGGLKTVHVANHASIHPVNKGIVREAF
jgi:hypothetical protein